MIYQNTGELNKNIADALLISPYSISNLEVPLQNAIALKLMKLVKVNDDRARRVAARAFGCEVPPMVVANNQQIQEIQKDLQLERNNGRIPHMQISWTPDGEYASQKVRKNIEELVKNLTGRLKVEYNIEGPHAGLGLPQFRDSYLHAVSQWYNRSEAEIEEV